MQKPSIDIFHKNPQSVRAILSNPQNLSHTADIKLENEILNLVVTPMDDSDRRYIDPMVVWKRITEKHQANQQVAETQETMRDLMMEVAHLVQALRESSDGLKEVSLDMLNNVSQTSSRADSASEETSAISGNIQTVATGLEEMTASVHVNHLPASRPGIPC